MQWLNVLRPVVLVMAVVHVATSYGVGYAALLFAFANSLGVIKIFPYLYAIYAGPFGYYLKDLLHPRVPETHSVCAPFTAVPGLTILPIAILANNYAYLVWCHETKVCHWGGGSCPLGGALHMVRARRRTLGHWGATRREWKEHCEAWQMGERGAPTKC